MPHMWTGIMRGCFRKSKAIPYHGLVERESGTHMKFRWEEKEKYFGRAEQELKDAGIDFMKVDRSQFGVQGFNEKEHTAEKVYVSLLSCSFRDVTAEKKRKLQNLGNWECLNGKPRRWGVEEKQIFMHSRLVFQN